MKSLVGSLSKRKKKDSNEEKKKLKLKEVQIQNGYHGQYQNKIYSKTRLSLTLEFILTLSGITLSHPWQGLGCHLQGELGMRL